MSASALLRAVAETIRSSCDFSAFQCEVHDDHQPHPSSGPLFIAVCLGGHSASMQSDQGLHESVRVSIGITLRFSGQPQDRIAENVYLKALSGLEAVARRVLLCVHRNYAIMSAANAYLTVEEGETLQGFITPLSFKSCSTPETKLGDWFWSTSETALTQKCGLFMYLEFDDSERHQTLPAT